MIDTLWSEFLFIAVLALILIGPKELPSVLRYMGKWIGKARSLGRNLVEQVNDMDIEERKPPSSSIDAPDISPK